MRIRRLPRAIAVPALLVALLVPAAPAAAAAPTVALTAEINDCEMTGSADLGASDQLVVKHLSASGTLRAKHTVTVVDTAWNIECPGPKVRGGDKLAFSVKGSSTPFRVFTVPRLTLRTDRVRDRVSGKAPGVSTVEVQLVGCDPAQFGCSSDTFEDVPVAPGTHAWTAHTMQDLKGGAYAVVMWQKGGDTIFRQQRFAQVVVRPGSATVIGFGPVAGTKQSVTVKRGTAVASGSPTTDANAAFSASVKRNGSKRTIKAGDIVKSDVASDAHFTVPPTSLTTIVGGVEGTCAPNSSVTVLYRSFPSREVQFGHLGTADGAGHWEVLDAVPPDTIVQSWCATSAGDAIVRELVER